MHTHTHLNILKIYTNSVIRHYRYFSEPVSYLLQLQNQVQGQQAVINQEPAYAKPQKSRSLSATSPTGSAGHAQGENNQLEAMLGDLSADMNRQGVSTKTKGVCAACNKAVVGQVRNGGVHSHWLKLGWPCLHMDSDELARRVLITWSVKRQQLQKGCDFIMLYIYRLYAFHGVCPYMVFASDRLLNPIHPCIICSWVYISHWTTAMTELSNSELCLCYVFSVYFLWNSKFFTHWLV